MRIQLTKWADYETIVTFPIYSGYRIHLVYTDSIGRSRAGRYGSAGTAADADGLFVPTAGADGFVFLHNWDAGTIAHEGFHAVRHMLVEWAGCEMDNENIAYHLGFLVRQIYDFKLKMEAFNEAKQRTNGRSTAARRNARPSRKTKARTSNPPRSHS